MREGGVDVRLSREKMVVAAGYCEDCVDDFSYERAVDTDLSGEAWLDADVRAAAQAFLEEHWGLVGEGVVGLGEHDRLLQLFHKYFLGLFASHTEEEEGDEG